MKTMKTLYDKDKNGNETLTPFVTFRDKYTLVCDLSDSIQMLHMWDIKQKFQVSLN